MFTVALIVFRESLEAALFIGIVAAATRQVAGRGRWLGAGVSAGVLGALLLAAMAEQVSGWFDGLGQDVINIAVLSVALVMLLWHCIWVSAHAKEMAGEARQLGSSVQAGDRPPLALTTAVALAVLREGVETVLFVGGAMAGGNGATIGEVVLATGIGVALGAGIGLVIYTGLSRIPMRHVFGVTNVLIAILAGSIASQLVKTLSQAGMLDVWTNPVWDTSRAVAQDSALGTFLKALVGYDAQPSGAQIASYAGVLLLIWMGTRLMKPPRA